MSKMNSLKNPLHDSRIFHMDFVKIHYRPRILQIVFLSTGNWFYIFRENMQVQYVIPWDFRPSECVGLLC